MEIICNRLLRKQFLFKYANVDQSRAGSRFYNFCPMFSITKNVRQAEKKTIAKMPTTTRFKYFKYARNAYVFAANLTRHGRGDIVWPSENSVRLVGILLFEPLARDAKLWQSTAVSEEVFSEEKRSIGLRLLCVEVEQVINVKLTKNTRRNTCFRGVTNIDPFSIQCAFSSRRNFVNKFFRSRVGVKSCF